MKLGGLTKKEFGYLDEPEKSDEEITEEDKKNGWHSHWDYGGPIHWHPKGEGGHYH